MSSPKRLQHDGDETALPERAFRKRSERGERTANECECETNYYFTMVKLTVSDGMGLVVVVVVVVVTACSRVFCGLRVCVGHTITVHLMICLL